MFSSNGGDPNPWLPAGVAALGVGAGRLTSRSCPPSGGTSMIFEGEREDFLSSLRVWVVDMLTGLFGLAFVLLVVLLMSIVLHGGT